ncbi:THAP domain-containing protein 2-like [Microplitis mediator]|uniref:THAP domain-containing protein 2-like n=1 Tax=Microplitis mediator TaxID=375433 RepID=UPI0025555739|nr:THAP domain-containing protein 2-like [Microplitis mediator]
MVICCRAPYCKHRERRSECNLYRFPIDPDRCKEWIKRFGIKDFIKLTPEQLNETKFICSCHFVDRDFILVDNKKHLNPDADPSILDLRTVPLRDEIINNFPPSKPVALDPGDPDSEDFPRKRRKVVAVDPRIVTKPTSIPPEPPSTGPLDNITLVRSLITSGEYMTPWEKFLCDF